MQIRAEWRAFTNTNWCSSILSVGNVNTIIAGAEWLIISFSVCPSDLFLSFFLHKIAFYRSLHCLHSKHIFVWNAWANSACATPPRRISRPGFIFLTMACWRPSTTMHQFQHTLVLLSVASSRPFCLFSSSFVWNSNRFRLKTMYNYTFALHWNACVCMLLNTRSHLPQYNGQLEMIRFIFINYRYFAKLGIKCALKNSIKSHTITVGLRCRTILLAANATRRCINRNFVGISTEEALKIQNYYNK